MTTSQSRCARSIRAAIGRWRRRARRLIAKAATELEAIRSRNVFPKWGVSWGTHPNFMGHDGCFRCHNSDLVSQDDQKRSISQSCTTCHRIEKMKEPVE